MSKIPIRERCQMCHDISPIGFWVPNDIWKNAVHVHWQNSVLCVKCFVKQADEKLIEWDKDIKFYPVSLYTHLSELIIPKEVLDGYLSNYPEI